VWHLICIWLTLHRRVTDYSVYFGHFQTPKLPRTLRQRGAKTAYATNSTIPCRNKLNAKTAYATNSTIPCRNKLNAKTAYATNSTIPCLTRHVTARDCLYGSQLKASGVRRLGLPASGGAPLRGGGMKLKSDRHRDI